MARLDDKIAIVTGGGQGIGQAIARKLAAEGATVVVTDVDEANAKATADALPGAVAIRADVTDRQGVQAMAERVAGQFGRIDVLVNNAGHRLRHRPDRQRQRRPHDELSQPRHRQVARSSP
jgi:2-hydroxycyclohexanecarboxyl-CoA dehydrogenase